MSAALDILPGQRLNFSEADRGLLSKSILSLIEQQESEAQPLLQNIDIWWDWFHAEPAQQRRTSPWADSSNAIIPLIRMLSEATAARRFNTEFAARDFFVPRIRSNTNRKLSHSVVEFLNWASDGNEFDLKVPGYDAFAEAEPIGSSILWLGWSTRTRQVFVPGDNGRPRPRTVLLSRGPSLVRVPRQDVLWQPGRRIHESEAVTKRAFMNRTQLAAMARVPIDEGGWDPEAVDRALKFPIHGSTSSDPSRAGHLRRSGFDPDGPAKLYDIREMWIEWPLLNGLGVQDPMHAQSDVPTPPIVITFERTSGTILRVIAKPYFIADWPCYEFNHRREGSGFHHSGLCKRLEHMQRVASTMLNQAVDTVTLANSILGITNDKKLLDQIWRPNKMLHVADMAGFREINLNKLIQPDVAMIRMVMAIAERDASMSDPNFGRETSIGGHPSPATSLLTLLRESEQILRSSITMDRIEFSRMGEDITTLYQQFETNRDGKLQRVLGRLDGDQVERWLIPRDQPIAGNVEFDVRAISETLNPEEERQRTLFAAQVLTDYDSRVLQLFKAAEDANAQGRTEFASVALNMIQGLSDLYSKILEASQIEDVETLVLNLQELRSGSQFQQLLSDGQQQVGDRLRSMVPGDTGPAVPAGAPGAPAGPNGGVAGSAFG